MKKLIRKLTPRFSVRTLLVLVVFVAGYFGAWKMTDRTMQRKWPMMKSRYSPAKDGYVSDCSTPMPFVVRLDVLPVDKRSSFVPRYVSRQYNLFLFGKTYKLPFESTLENETSVTGVPPSELLFF